MATPNIFLYVQNLLGIGHLRRAAAIARALINIGFEVNFVSGGIPIPNLNVASAKFHQLPPVRSLDRNFKMLVDETGECTITNDGATILKLLDVKHPAAKLLCQIADQQDYEVIHCQ